MPKKGLSLRKMRELLRMTSCETQMSARAMAIRLGVARSTVQDCLRRIAAAGLTWPVPDDLTDDVLERNTNLR